MRIENVIKHTKRLEVELATVKEEYEHNKALIQKYFDKHGLEYFETEAPNDAHTYSKLKAVKRERVYIDYDVEALQEKLDKEVFNEIAIKQYTIKDMAGLVKLLKAAGVVFKKFKQFLHVDIKIDAAKVKQLYAVGDITKEDLSGCFEAKIVKSIEIKEIK